MVKTIVNMVFTLFFYLLWGFGMGYAYNSIEYQLIKQRRHNESIKHEVIEREHNT